VSRRDAGQPEGGKHGSLIQFFIHILFRFLFFELLALPTQYGFKCLQSNSQPEEKHHVQGHAESVL
jgi:hypothetical protein